MSSKLLSSPLLTDLASELLNLSIPAHPPEPKYRSNSWPVPLQEHSQESEEGAEDGAAAGNRDGNCCSREKRGGGSCSRSFSGSGSFSGTATGRNAIGGADDTALNALRHRAVSLHIRRPRHEIREGLGAAASAKSMYEHSDHGPQAQNEEHRRLTED
jgi:hypothetical protein